MKNLPYLSFLRDEIHDLFETSRVQRVFLILFGLVLFQIYIVVIVFTAQMRIEGRFDNTFAELGQQLGVSRVLQGFTDSSGCNVTVTGGQSITDAARSLSSGQTLCITSGTYNQKVVIDNKNNITIAGVGSTTPIIDGQQKLPDPNCLSQDRGGSSGLAGREPRPGCIHNSLFSLKNSNNVTITNIEIAWSSGRGMLVSDSSNVILKYINTHNNWNKGLVVHGDSKHGNIVVEQSTIWNNIWARWERGLIGGGGFEMHGIDGGTFRNNKVFNNYGEGVNVGKAASNILVEGNMLFNNSHTSLYNNAAYDTVFNANLIFCEDDWPACEVGRADKYGPGLTFRNESLAGAAANRPAGSNNIASNNVIVGCSTNIVLGTQANKPLKDTMIVNNTLVGARKVPGSSAGAQGFRIGSGNYQNVLIANNIVANYNDQPTFAGNLNAVTLRNNIADATPQGGNRQGITVADPKLATTFSGTGVDAATIDPRDYVITAGSPAVNAGASVSNPTFTRELTIDFFGNTRDSQRDIGMFELNGQTEWSRGAFGTEGSFAEDACLPPPGQGDLGTGAIVPPLYCGEQVIISEVDSPLNPGNIDCTSSSVVGLSTQPCSVYKEYKIVNTHNNRNWRVTGDDATAVDAQRFIPNPVLDIEVDDLEHAVRAEVMLDVWGGHAGTQKKRISINDNDWINLPVPRFDLPAQDDPSTSANETDPDWYFYQYNPIIDVPLSQLEEGANTIQGNASRCDEGTCKAWPQWGMNAVMIRVYYDPAVKSGPTGKIVHPIPNATINEYQTIHVAGESEVGIERIDVMANYYGYDENGDGFYKDWHRGYFVAEKKIDDVTLFDITGHVGSTTANPGVVTWDTTWVPDQEEKQIQLIARVKDKNGYWTVTTPVNGLSLYRPNKVVEFFEPDKQTIKPGYGVRAGQVRSSTVTLPNTFDESTVERVRAHIRTWNGELHGGSDPHGTFTLNGTYDGTIGGLSHLYKYTTPEIEDTTVLQPGENTFSFTSTTVHHKNEILWPGPGLSVRYGVELLCPPLTPIVEYDIEAQPTLYPDLLTGILLDPIVANDTQIVFTFSNVRRNSENGSVLADEIKAYIDIEDKPYDISLLEQNENNRVWINGDIQEGVTVTGEDTTFVVTTLDELSFTPIEATNTFFGVEINWGAIMPIVVGLVVIGGIGIVLSRQI